MCKIPQDYLQQSCFLLKFKEKPPYFNKAEDKTEEIL